MRRLAAIIAVLMTSFVGASAHAQVPPSRYEPDALAQLTAAAARGFREQIFGALAQEEQRNGWIALPVVSVQPETSLQLGAFGFGYFKPESFSPDTPSSAIGGAFIYTLKRQIIAGTQYDIQIRDGEFQWFGTLGYQRFPDLFWGVGTDTPSTNEESYEVNSVVMENDVRWRFDERAFVAGQQRFYRYRSSNDGPESLLAREDFAGEGTDIASGLGVAIAYDSRDNLFYTTRGSFTQFSTIVFPRAFGSTRTFERLELDLRHFIPTFPRQALGVQFFSQLHPGRPGFNAMARLGGGNYLRGIYRGRYRDKHMYVLQAEYRAHVVWRIGVAAFGGIGDVAPELGAFSADTIKWSAGGGLRFQLSEEGINIRADVGWGSDGAFGYYLLVREAF